MNEKILVTRSSMPPYEEYINEIKDIWDTRWLTNMGSKHEAFAQKLEQILNVPFVSLFTNGHLALEACLGVMNLSGEVITTPYTFVSTTHAITRNGLKPVFCDISPDTYTIDADKIEALITPQTTAIVPVHVYGNVCDVEKIQKIADKYNLKVIYDAAHAFYETYKGKNVASFGNASMYSFHATKVFHTIEGGAVTTSDKTLLEKLYNWKNFGIEQNGEINSIGANAKMNEFQAAMGLCNLRHLEEEIASRKKVVERYIENLQDIPGIILQRTQENVKSNYAYFPVVFEEKIFGVSRDTISDELKKHNIFSRKYFYPLTNDCGCYSASYSSDDTPIAKHIAASVLTLPLYAHLPLETVDFICDIIRKLGKESKTC